MSASSHSPSRAIGGGSGGALKAIDHVDFIEVALRARASGIAHRRAPILMDEKWRNGGGGMRRRARRKQHASAAVGDVVLRHRLAVGEHGDAHGHEIKECKRAIVPASDDPTSVGRAKNGELVGTLTEKAYG